MPIPGSGLPRGHLEPWRKGVLSKCGARGRAVPVRNGSQDVLKDEVISRGELGDNLIATPGDGTLGGQRADISAVGGPEVVLWDGRGDG